MHSGFVLLDSSTSITREKKIPELLNLIMIPLVRIETAMMSLVRKHESNKLITYQINFFLHSSAVER